MNKELKDKILLEAVTWGDNMVSNSDFARRVISLCADEAIDAVDDATKYRSCVCGKSAIKAIEKRMK